MVISIASTFAISSVGMFGEGHKGWGISTDSHGFDLVVGASRKLAEVDGRFEPYEVICMTIIFDHELINGAPAARFMF